jgi:Uma2 family endonuclease
MACFIRRRAQRDHMARRARHLIGDLVVAFDKGRGGPGGWRLRYEPELHLREDILVSDIAGWRRTRMTETPKGAFITLAPDWVCEVLSPSTAKIDRTKKLGIYARDKCNTSGWSTPNERPSKS